MTTGRSPLPTVRPEEPERQIDEGTLSMRPGRMKGFVWSYFQPFSNTHAPVAQLLELYAEALAHPWISGLVIGTWPDCVDDEKLDLLAELARKRLCGGRIRRRIHPRLRLRAVRRGHDFAAARQAIAASAARGVARQGGFISGAARRRRRNASSTGGADQCPAAPKRSVPPVAARSGTTPRRAIRRRSPAASACVPEESTSRWWSRCCGGCVPIWLWSVSPAKCRWVFTT